MEVYYWEQKAIKVAKRFTALPLSFILRAHGLRKIRLYCSSSSLILVAMINTMTKRQLRGGYCPPVKQSG